MFLFQTEPFRTAFEEREALEDAYGGRVSGFDAAMLRLLEAPASDFEAVGLKIGLLARHPALDLNGGEECLAWIEADARRLA